MASTGSPHQQFVKIMKDDEAPTAVVREIDDNSWIINQAIVVSRHAPGSRPSGLCWGDGEGRLFSISEAPSPPPPTRASVSAACPITPIFYFRDGLGTWMVGGCHLRIDNTGKGTPEHVTLERLRKRQDETKRPWSFQLPEVFYHAQHGDRYYIAYRAPRGRPMCEVWPTITDEATKKDYARQIAQTCGELCRWRGERISGVDGSDLRDWDLHDFWQRGSNPNSPEQLRKNANEMGMDGSDVVFAHNFLRPHSFIVDGKRLVGIIEWDKAGFVPRDWVLTKPRLNALYSDKSCLVEWSKAQKASWLVHIWEALGEVEVDGKKFGDYWEKSCLWAEAKMKEGERREGK